MDDAKLIAVLVTLIVVVMWLDDDVAERWCATYTLCEEISQKE